MIISFSGTPGSGKSSIATAIAKKLQYKHYYMGGLQREIAKKKGLSIQEYNEYCKQNKQADEEIDYYQKELGETQDNFVIEGRTSFFFIPQSYKIYLSVDLKEAAKRIIHDSKNKTERNEDIYQDVEVMAANIQARIDNESERYKKHFGFSCHDTNNYDLVIDTTTLSPDEVVKKILLAIREQQSI